MSMQDQGGATGISVVFSFKNEEQNIRELVRRTSATIEAIPGIEKNYELVFVDDASTDNSSEIIRELAESFPIKLITMSRTFGTAPCVLAGLEHCSGAVAVYMDSDLQDPPELIAEMYEMYRTGYDVVHATRTERAGEPSLKMWMTKIAYKVIGWASQVELRENTGDFKLLSRRAVDSILTMKETDPYMRGLSVWVGFKQGAVLYQREARHAGKTKFTLLAANPRREFIRGLTSFSDGPLMLSIYVGMLVSLGAGAAIIYAIIAKVVGLAVPGSSGIIIFIALFSGSILLSNGILGLYISKIFFEVKRRPPYIVESVFSSTNGVEKSD